MLINNERFNKKDPETKAFLATQAFYFLYRDKDLVSVLVRDAIQHWIDLVFTQYFLERVLKEHANRQASQYVV